MIQTTEELKQKRPDLVELFENMNREQLLEQIYKEVQDGLNMQERVEVFMELCTPDMSYTTYTPESIRTLVKIKEEADISNFVDMIMQDMEFMNDKEKDEYLKTFL